MSAPSASRWAGLGALAAGVVACMAVAVSAAGEPLRGADGSTTRVPGWQWLLIVPIAALLVLGLLALASFRRGEGVRVGDVRHRRGWLLVLLSCAAIILLVRDRDQQAAEDQPVFEIAPDRPEPGSRSTPWPIWLVVAGGAGLAVVAVLRRRRPSSPAIPLSAVEEVEQALEHSSAALATTGDPRQAVIAAYAHLLDGLSKAGAGRRSPEAPFEHVHRVLTDLGVRPEPLQRLTSLFAEARFSTHPITEDHRAAALEALAEARADLAVEPEETTCA